MILLALETSSPVESAALLDGPVTLGHRAWPGDRVHARPLFDSLRALLRERALEPGRIEAYAVGLGPGSFAGLRMALSCVLGMALPGERPVYGLPSAEAAAAGAAADTGRRSVVVCGDGRRGRAWLGCLDIRDGLPVPRGDWRLEPLADLAAFIPAGAAVCTAQFDLLAAPLREAANRAGAEFVERSVHPDAAVLGRLALLRMERGIPSLPLSPLYLHPPVFVPPSFVDADGPPAQESPA